MKYIFNFIATVTLLFTAACGGGNGLIEEPTYNEGDELVSVSIDVVNPNSNETTRGVLDSWMSSPASTADDLSLLLFYENQVVGSYDYRNLTFTAKNDSTLSFNLTLPKRWNPSLVDLVFLCQPSTSFAKLYSLRDDCLIYNHFKSNDNYQHSVSYCGKFKLAQENDWKNIVTSFHLKKNVFHLIVLTDEFYTYFSNQVPEISYPSNFGNLKYSPLEFSFGFDYSDNRDFIDFYYNDYGASASYAKLYSYFPVSYDFRDDIVYLRKESHTFQSGTQTPYNSEGESHFPADYGASYGAHSSTVTFKGRKMACVVSSYIPWSKEVSYGKMEDAYNEETDVIPAFLRVIGRSTTSIAYPYTKDYAFLSADKCIPIPEGGFKANKVYIYYNKENTNIFNFNLVHFKFRDVFQGMYRYNREITPIYTVGEETRGSNDFCFEEYDLNEPLPEEVKSLVGM